MLVTQINEISRRSYLHSVEMTSRLVKVLACHSEMSFLAIEESLLLVTQINEISRRSYLRSVEMTSRFNIKNQNLNPTYFYFS